MFSSVSRRSSKRSLSKTPTRDVSGTMLIGKEESSTGSVGFGVYVRYFKSIGYMFCTVIILGGVANQAFSVYSSIWLSDWSADAENNVPHIRDMYLGVYGGLGVAQCNFPFNFTHRTIFFSISFL